MEPYLLHAAIHSILELRLSEPKIWLMSLEAEVGAVRAAKRARHVAEVADHTFQFQSLRLNEWGQLWSPNTLGLHSSYTILIDGCPPHGSWEITEEGYLSVKFNYRADEDHLQHSLFDKVPQADAWATIRCKPEWAAMLVPRRSTGCEF